MYKLRSIARRGTMFAGAGALLFASMASGSSAFADALNPLTHRSLTLSSSSPGWDYTDGSGNGTYATPNTGANGQKTGNTFSFNVSTDSSSSNGIKGFSFQYCTHSAGDCTAPGNNAYVGSAGSYTGRTSNADAITAGSKTSDLNIVSDSTNTPRELTSTEYAARITSGAVTSIPPADDSGGNFVVMSSADGVSNWTYDGNWVMAVSNNESGQSLAAGKAIGTNNYITLNKTSTNQTNVAAGTAFKIIFFATNDNYITNPGAGAFFVKINDYKTNDPAQFTDANVIDGGVTVANVMNQSIQITTKVLETMDFSVGTVDPYTLNDTQLSAATNGDRTYHGQCDPILPSMTYGDTKPNTLNLGDESGEYSLSTAATYSTHSYWRLSSNSSAGATVYYAGVTLSNTVGDQIQPQGSLTKAAPSKGTPQFGLALANGTIAANVNGSNVITSPFNVNYAVERDSQTPAHDFESGADNTATAGVDASVGTDVTAHNEAGYHAPQLAPMRPTTNYDQGAGNVNTEYGTVNTAFAFDPNSNTIPTALATESSQVVDCVTAKVRYIANIAATTPAGIYTTKINYIAAPQY